MIAVTGSANITLKTLMVRDGFPHLADYASRGRSRAQELNGVFNCSYTQAQMNNRVLQRWSWLSSDLPIINKTLVTNKLQAQKIMKRNGMSENILPHLEVRPEPLNQEEWVVKPYASQGGVGIRIYDGRPLHGTYLQRKTNKVREFRAHVGLWLNNPVFTIQEKKPKPELWEATFGRGEYADTGYTWPANSSQRARLPVTWNIESGFYFKRATTPSNRADKVRRFGLFRRIEEAATKAVKTLGYQYGAVDILMDEDRNLWVVEINSHPAIKNENSKAIYLEALAPLKTITKVDLFSLTQQTTGGTISRVMTRNTSNY